MRAPASSRLRYSFVTLLNIMWRCLGCSSVVGFADKLLLLGRAHLVMGVSRARWRLFGQFCHPSDRRGSLTSRKRTTARVTRSIKCWSWFSCRQTAIPSMDTDTLRYFTTDRDHLYNFHLPKFISQLIRCEKVAEPSWTAICSPPRWAGEATKAPFTFLWSKST